MYNEDEFLMLSGIQHFSFCRRQWALIHIEGKWCENRLTAEGRHNHHRVHDESVVDIRNGVITMRGLRVYSRAYGISGECDAVEFQPTDDDGIVLNGRDGVWAPAPIEYKRGSSKVSDCDRLQLVAQIMCLEEMLSCKIDYGYLFYFETRRREKVDATQELRDTLKDMLEEMHAYMNREYTPKVKPSVACRNCSLNTECLPQIMKKKESVATYIKKHIEEDVINEKNA